MHEAPASESLTSKPLARASCWYVQGKHDVRIMNLKTKIVVICWATLLLRPLPAQELPETLPEFTALQDLAYVTDGHVRQKLDLYLPKHASEPTPLILWIHGGGWANGSKANCPPLQEGLTEQGYAVGSMDYRLSGDAIFPAQIEDCKAAIRWLRAHAAEYNLDPDRIGVWGSSAGGHLVALLGTSGHVTEFDVGEHLDHSSQVQAVCDFYGPTDLLQMDAHALPTARMKHDAADSPESRLIGGPIQAHPAQAAKANPITYVSQAAPPFLIVHGDKDPLVPLHQSQLLFEALKSAGVHVRFHTLKGAGHGAGFAGKELETMVREFFDRHLKNASNAAADTPVAEATMGRGQPILEHRRGGERGRISWETVRQREAVADDGRVTKADFKGPPSMFERLDRNQDGVISKDDFASKQ
jgi:acetyl esterase/lipase